MRLVYILFLSFYTSYLVAQNEPNERDLIGHRVVIGLPEITLQQLNGIKAEFQQLSQIATAKYIGQSHGCLLVTFTGQQGVLVQYYDLLKRMSTYYDVSKCYFKIDAAFDEIENSTKADYFLILK